MEFTAAQIAQFVQGRVEGDENATVNTFAKIEEGKEGAISFLSNPKYTHFVYDTKSSIVLIDENVELDHPVSTTLIRVKNAYECVAKLLQMYESMKPKKTGIDPLAFVSPKAKVAENVYIGAFAYISDGAEVGEGSQIYPHAYIGEGVKIGKNALIYPHVTIYHGCKLGDNVTLHAGCVIGADGFGFAPGPDGYDKIPQIGIVTIEDDVEIGANTCIDRGALQDTVIEEGVKLDNLIQIGHNVKIGAHTALAGCVGVAGSAVIGAHCTIGGGAIVLGHLSLADGVNVSAATTVTRSITKPGHYTGMFPLDENAVWEKNAASLKQLHRLRDRVRALEKALSQTNQPKQQDSP